MRRPHLIFLAGVLLLATAVAALAGGSPLKPLTAADFGKQRFDRSATVDNKWFPLKPGTQLVFEGATSEGSKRIPHRLVYTVTDLVKTVAGVRSAVVWDRDYSDGELVEAELSFFAQDNAGNVWHTGEYPEEYENGKRVGAPAWIGGVKGAWAGIHMLASPRPAMPAYAQGYAPPPVNWTDHGKVLKVGQTTCVPAACYDNVLVVREFNPDEPGKSQLKHYAPGLGNVRVGWAGNDPGKEVLELVAVKHLGPGAMGAARAEALRLEARAYRIKKNVYGKTPPATRIGA